MKKSQVNKLLAFKLSTTVVITLISGLIGYCIGLNRHDNETPKQNTPGYITVESARDQVNNFYQQYLHPGDNEPEKRRNILVSNYGDKNLVFYKTYYRHGFDPIVCSAIMPTSVTVADIQPGASATVTAKVVYPDGATENIDLTLVLNAEGFRIDTITCPGDKGNLPPQF